MEERISKSKIVNFNKSDLKKEGKVTYIYDKETLDMKDIDMEVSVDMDENRLLEKYLDKVDQDRRDQELRLNSNM